MIYLLNFYMELIMTIINHSFTSPIWMTSTLDNKKEIKTKLNQANAAGYPVHLIDNEQEEKRKSLTWWPNNNDSAILDNTIDNFTLSLPSKWNEHNLEFELNHFNPQGRSILISIDSIDDKYSQLKTKLALQVIHSLEHSTVNLTNVMPSRLDIFSKALFIKNPEINNFVDKLIENYLKKLHCN